MFVEMKVRGLALDPLSNMPIIILRDEDDKRSLPIWVGIFEANAIALELEKISTPRPMTHDLIKNILEAIEARVVKVAVTDLKENTFFAVLHLQVAGAEYQVDSRPSDAIALALRVGAPIYVDEDVVRKAKTLDVATPKEADTLKADDPERVREWLGSIKPEDFCGGVTTSVETLRRGLEARGHEAWVLAPRFRTETADGPRVIRYPSIPAATYPEFALAVPFAPRITRRVRRLEVDVFHSHHPFLLGPAARRLARQQRRPLVFTYHTRYDKYAHYVPFRRSVVEGLAVRLSTRFAAGADAVIAPSCVIRDELITRGVRTPIAVVPTGVDLARFQPGLDPRDMIVLYVGRLDREKSVDLILLAFERVAGTVSRARLVLVGDGTQREELRRRAARSAVSERVTFLGVRPHDTLPTCYQAADLFVFASETETQGLVLAEAAACGLPAVAVAAPGCNEVVRDGETGVLTKGDPGGLAEAVIGLLVDVERRRVMGARAREVAESEFDVRLQIDRTLAVYERARSRLVGRRR